jgi:predicted metal-dependent hydrolase
MKRTLPDYQVRHSSKAKSLRLRVTRDDGLLVVVPRGFDEKRIPPLLKLKKNWIADAIQRVGETKRFLEPKPLKHIPTAMRLAALGETWTLTCRDDERHTGIRLRVKNEELVITGPHLNQDAVIRKLKDWLRSKVREDLFPLAQKLAGRHHLKVRGLLVKSQRTRWASCSAQKNLSLNTKLLFLSPDLVRYVIIHELCHTVHMSHSGEFWRLLAAHEPKYKVLDETLREAWKSIPPWVF